MRISLYSGTTLYPLAGQSGVSERVHSSADQVTISPQAELQVAPRVRATHALHLDRANLATSISFSTSRKFSTVAEAEQWALAYDANFPRTGTLYLDTVSPLGVVTRQTMADAVVSPPTRKCTGATVLLDYQAQGGAIATGTVIYPGSLHVTGTLTDGTDPVVFPALLEAGTASGKTVYTDLGGYYGAGGYDYICIWTVPGDLFQLVKFVSGTPVAAWYSTDDVATPDLVTTWLPSGSATGTPVVTFTP